MSYLTPTNVRRKNEKFFSLFLPFIILFLVLVFLFPYLNPLFLSLSYSAKKTLSNFSFVIYLKSKKTLSEENELLKNKINDLTALNADRDALFQENEELNEKIGRKNEDSYILADVLERPGFSPYDFFVLKAGSSRNVLLGDKILYNNFALGEIVEISDKFSKAELYSSSGKSVDVLVGNKKTPIKATGQGGGSFEILLPKGVDVVPNDPVYLASDSKKVLGFVGGISEDAGDSLDHVFFSLPVNIYEINTVSIKK